MKKIIIVLLCLSSLLCFARVCSNNGCLQDGWAVNDGLCADCAYKKFMKSEESKRPSQKKKNDFDLDVFPENTFSCIFLEYEG